MATEDYKKGNSNMIFLVLAVLILLVGIIFALQNADPIPIKFIGWEFKGSLALVLAVVFVGGVLLGLFTIINNVWRRDRMISQQKKEIKNLNGQVQALKDENASVYKEKFNEREKGGSSAGSIKDFEK